MVPAGCSSPGLHSYLCALSLSLPKAACIEVWSVSASYSSKRRRARISSDPV